MKNGKLQLYSIMPLNVERIEEYCNDMKEQYDLGVMSCALFLMTLVPEGNPPVDKVGPMCEKYDLFKAKLDAMGVPNGVLVQATIGHGYKLGHEFPFQSYTGLVDGSGKYTVCPYDKGFHEYIYNVMKTIASHEPDCIMVDDDFRLLARPAGGCACPMHMARFNELAKTNLTREELYAITSDKENENSKKYWDIFVETQRESLLESAKVMRAGIDAVNPKLPGSFCCCGNNAEFSDEIAKILAGEGNPSVVRINNGRYSKEGTKYFTSTFQRAATQIEKIKDKVDIILAETDTCPQNRYSTSALSLHTHFTGSIIEGCTGAKHWITRLHAFELESGKAYRKTLGKYSGFYEKLAEIVPTLSWKGCRMHVSKRIRHVGGYISNDSNNWAACVLERMGIPLYYSSKKGGVLCMDGSAFEFFTDEEILDVLSGPVILASDSVEYLISRGFGEYLGVSVREWEGKPIMGEQLFVNGNKCTAQMKTKELVPLSDDVLVDSMTYNTVDRQNYELLFPATTIYKNKLGGTVIAFAGSPYARYVYTEAYSFLNFSRKKQIVRLLRNVNELPVYFDGDEEVYFRAADMADGGLFAGVFNTGFDPIDKLELTVVDRNIKKIFMLNENGERKQLDFIQDGEVCKIDIRVNTLEPVILFMY